jgi:8-oxo-dGTP pyrophosphatase MutT (NUDIX family)
VRWTVHGAQPIYDSDWVRLELVDVEIPGERRFQHHVIRMPCAASGTVIEDPERGILLIWRHRFITDTWGWEIPAGRIDPGETAEQAAHREALEETGWRPGPLQHLTTYHPTNGISDHTFHLFAAQGAEYVGEPSDPSESERVEWVPTQAVAEIVGRGQMTDGLSLTAVLYVLARDRLEPR